MSYIDLRIRPELVTFEDWKSRQIEDGISNLDPDVFKIQDIDDVLSMSCLRSFRGYINNPSIIFYDRTLDSKKMCVGKTLYEVEKNVEEYLFYYPSTLLYKINQVWTPTYEDYIHGLQFVIYAITL